MLLDSDIYAMFNRALIFFLFIFPNILSAQGADSETAEIGIRKNDFHLELGGASVFYSLNLMHYDRVSEKVRFGVGLGISYMRFDPWTPIQIVSAPLSASLIFGKTRHFIETGLGFTVGLIGNSPQLSPNFSTAYRFEGKKGFQPKVLKRPSCVR